MSLLNRLAPFFVIIFTVVVAVADVPKSADAGLHSILKKIKGDVVSLTYIDDGQCGLILGGRSLVLFDAASGKEIYRHQFGTSERPLKMDVVDIDSDGDVEVAVTSLSAGSLSSYLFEYKGLDNFEVVAKDLPYFLRVLKYGGKEMLLAQASIPERPFAGAVYELIWKAGRLKRGAHLDLPRQTGIYQFSPIGDDREKLWIRADGGFLKRFEKQGRKWKTVYKTTEKYRGGVNCFLFKKEKALSEDVEDQVCVPTPLIVITNVNNELVILDDHQFLLGGVILKPALPRKAYIDLLMFTDAEGLTTCKQWGPYQGWIGDYFLDTRYSMLDPRKKVNEHPASSIEQRVIVIINGGGKYGTSVKTIDITD